MVYENFQENEKKNFDSFCKPFFEGKNGDEDEKTWENKFDL